MEPWKIRIGVLGLLLCGLWILLGTSSSAVSQTQPGPGNEDPAGIQVVSTLLATGVQQIVVLDPQAKSMAVYHVEPVHGKIQLKSVRRLVWDLQMEQFNAETPLPSELRQVQP